MNDVEMVPTEVGEQWSLLLPRHRAVRGETWGSWWPYWELPRLQSMWHNLNVGDLVFDIGSEEGDLPGLWALWGCRVVLVEPNPRVWPNLKAIWDANGFLDPAGTYVGFCGPADDMDRPEWIAEHIDAQPHGIWPSCANGPVIGDHGFLDLRERPDCPVITLDTLADRCGEPDAITIDVEGAEGKVLEGAECLMGRGGRRPLIWVSVHPYFLYDYYGMRPDEFLAWLNARGYQRTHLGFDHEWHWFCWPEERRDSIVLPYGGR